MPSVVSLILRTILVFLFLLAVLGLVLFVSAGSFSFWQAWVYLSVFAACVILITLYLYANDRELLEGRVKAGPVAEQEKSQMNPNGGYGGIMPVSAATSESREFESK